MQCCYLERFSSPPQEPTKKSLSKSINYYLMVWNHFAAKIPLRTYDSLLLTQTTTCKYVSVSSEGNANQLIG